jgi:hypothetical protein
MELRLLSGIQMQVGWMDGRMVMQIWVKLNALTPSGGSIKMYF